MNLNTIDSLHSLGHITDEQKEQLSKIYSKKIFSLFYELRTMLYLGVLLFASGVGVLVYKNIDTIGHQVIILLLILLMAACFWFVWKKKSPYSHAEVQSPGVLFDYAMLLGSLLLATIIGYLQFQYSVFGEHWELGALIPALAYFPLAYRFDHRGVLSLGITGIASWLGLTVSPVGLMEESIFPQEQLVLSGLIFGALTMGTGLLLERKGIKKHFTFTYMNFGFLVFGVASLGGLFILDQRFLFFILIAGLCVLGVYYARKEQSFFFLLMSSLFGYCAVTYLLLDVVEEFFFWQLYFVLSCAAMIYGLFKYKTFLAR